MVEGSFSKGLLYKEYDVWIARLASFIESWHYKYASEVIGRKASLYIDFTKHTWGKSKHFIGPSLAIPLDATAMRGRKY